MPIRLWLTALAGAVALAAMAAACGGGGGGGDGQGARVTDPAQVPSSTPIGQGAPTKFQMRGGVLQAIGGQQSTPAPGSTPTGSTGGATTYTVQSGDTCGQIASNHGITLDQLINANRNIVDATCTNLHPGDQLKIPAKQGATNPQQSTTSSSAVPTPTPRPSGRTYTVQSGDTCFGIAGNQGVSVADLIRVNSLDANCTIKPGDVLKIP